MAATKISALSAATYLDGSEELPLAQGGANEKATVSQIVGGAYVVLQADYTLTSTTSAQKLFNSSTNGALTLPTGVYTFEGMIHLTTMSATSGNASVNVLGAGTAVIARPLIQTVGQEALAAAGGVGGQFAAASGTTGNATSAGTTTTMGIRVSGVIDVTTGGTIIPSVGLTTAASAVVKAGSYFRLTRIGPTATATLGNWS